MASTIAGLALLTRAAPRQHHGCVTIPPSPRDRDAARRLPTSRVARVARPPRRATGIATARRFSRLRFASSSRALARPGRGARARTRPSQAIGRTRATRARCPVPRPPPIARLGPDLGRGALPFAPPPSAVLATDRARLPSSRHPSRAIRHQEPTNTSRSSGRRSRAMCSASSSACACGSTASSPPWCA